MSTGAEVSGQGVKQIPFTVEEEALVASGGRWMRFMAVVQIVGGVLGLVGLVFGLGLLGLAMMSGKMTAELEATPMPVSMDALVAGLVVGGVLLAVTVAAALWGGVLLYRAGDYLDRVAKTDEADQDYLVFAFGNLKTFFIIEAVFGAFTVLSAVNVLVNPLFAMGAGQ